MIKKITYILGILLIVGCSTTPSKGCGYFKSQQKKIKKYNKKHSVSHKFSFK